MTHEGQQGDTNNLMNSLIVPPEEVAMNMLLLIMHIVHCLNKNQIYLLYIIQYKLYVLFIYGRSFIYVKSLPTKMSLHIGRGLRFQCIT